MSRKRNDYAVGHGRPPVQHQFQKGRSGNPSGRPKKRPTLAVMVEQALHKQIAYREGNQTKRAAAFYVLVSKMLNRALTDDAKAVDQILKLWRHAGPERENGRHDTESSTPHDYTWEVRHKIEQLAERHAKVEKNTSSP